ncbi:MAG: DUF349 domain-containing protein [Rikenellaceae bacterium]|nr:DUF349 domain-containing protein [Rikenellaceae bacterium]
MKTIDSVPMEQVGENAEDVQQPTATAEAVDEPQNVTAEESVEPAESVDFSDEEAMLAAEQADVALGEEAEGEEPSGDATVSYSGKSKAELVEILSDKLRNEPVQTLRSTVEAIKIAFYKAHKAEIESLRREAVEKGADPDNLNLPTDTNEVALKALIAEYRTKRDEYIAGLEKSKEESLKIKLTIIEELKALINSNETLNQTFATFRELQQRWKEAGPVPQANVKDVWETYNHHIENFYEYIKINKELRDMDLKRNYEAKIALCEEAEALFMEPSVVTAFHSLQKLHDEWREIGPVAAEYKEELWNRFKEASSRINKRHQQYFDEIKQEQQSNLELKTKLCEQTEELNNTDCESRKEWNKASEKLLEIQKVWKTIGFAPKKENTKIYERFRAACDTFFERKRNYYSGLKDQMEENLALKTRICEQAEAVMMSEDWKSTGDRLIDLQRQWKEIGAVPRRQSDAVWKRFRAACDTFFERKAAHFSSVDSEHKDNLARKRALLEEMEAFDLAAISFEAIKEFQRRWSEIGFVPIKQKESIQKQYKEAVDKLFGALRGSERDRNMDKFRNHISNLKQSGDKRLRYERERLYGKVKQLEADIATLENNIGFFAGSKNAESLISEVRVKIAKAKADMAEAIKKVQAIDAAEQE